ncbi:MAG: hypothetical protein JST54_06180 [Deltaproteobacteria bacterium]|nr:hypothetical protein [Deltaproteobacteria bacterium]
MRLARLVCISLVLAFAPAAHAESDLLKNARNTFEYGNYDESLRLTETLLASHQLSAERDLVEAYRIAGLSDFYLSRPEGARRHFVALLSVDPDYAMDPFLVPPPAVAFFDGVKRDNESLLAPIRERRKALAEQERLADEARRKLIEENLMRQLEPERPVLVQTVEVHTFATNFVPFGAGQFQENRPVLGSVFAGTQVIGLATAIGSFAKIESLRDEHGYFAQADIGTVNNLVTAKWLGVGMLSASVVLGIADSLWHYEPTTTRIEALPQPPHKASAPKPDQPPAPSPQPPPAKPASDPTPSVPVTPHTQLFHPTLVPVATDRGLGIGLGFRF